MTLVTSSVGGVLLAIASFEMNRSALLKVSIRGFVTTLQRWTPCQLRGTCAKPDEPAKFEWIQYETCCKDIVRMDESAQPRLASASFRLKNVLAQSCLTLAVISRDCGRSLSGPP